MKGYRTYLVAGLAVILGAGSMVDWWSIVDVAAKGDEVLLGMGMVMGIFRSLTTTKAGQKE